MAAYRRVYDSCHLQADCQEPGSAPEPYARQSSMGQHANHSATKPPSCIVAVYGGGSSSQPRIAYLPWNQDAYDVYVTCVCVVLCAAGREWLSSKSTGAANDSLANSTLPSHTATVLSRYRPMTASHSHDWFSHIFKPSAHLT